MDRCVYKEEGNQCILEEDHDPQFHEFLVLYTYPNMNGEEHLTHVRYYPNGIIDAS